MKNILRAIIATLLLTGAAFSANAADASHTRKAVDLTSGAAKYTASFASGLASATFTDQFSFHVDTKSLLAADVTSTAASAAVGLDLTSFAIYKLDGTLLYSGAQKSTGRVDNWKLNTSNLVLTAGDYYLQVIGKINSAGAGSLSGNIALKALAVPEAETYAMLLAGLGLVGFVARRNKRA
ncbi:PEP-CTERM sorting domain-containing protein [Pseudoduganella sp. FT26W]|uniref:PEP-CTERM sorting domain-containing protein n=1 Tax=Duganella aquatilis TaxID=2666082 RepID=A0A844CZK4_9BURK|nr:FxDxF family PEP-CTERM protein [Duganella aquatilis]MRW86247.1 PEP-CTERM sorting domain-containing protein [Duganella aquatilis]